MPTGSRDPNIVPAYKALEILIQLMSGTKNSSAMIVTGYPRNMRDVVEFLARVSQWIKSLNAAQDNRFTIYVHCLFVIDLCLPFEIICRCTGSTC